MDASSSSNTGSGPQKRVLPARSRRGGPGLGTCDVDVMILEAHKRKMEAEPLVPADTPFLLTTNSSKFSVDSERDPESTFTINTVANERYFDRPEVLRAFREQQIIQTPDFEAINESSTVGGRFRPRGAEDETAETSDATYEKRHKKFETFEKRQRLREKEKLKHEHYKLKERIEQLRAMDSSAFMAVPASSFSEPPPEEHFDTEEVALHPNGMVVNVEGERRRQEMLDNALALERRYSYLLPPDRVRKLAQDVSSHTESHHEYESDTDRILQIAGPSRRDASETFKFRVPAKSSASNTPAPSPVAVSAPKPSTGRKSKAAIAAAASPIASPIATPKVPTTFRAIHTPASYAAQREHAAAAASDVPPVSVIADEPRRSPSPIPPPETPAESPAAVPVPVAVISAGRGRKRGRGGRPPNGSLISRQIKTKPVEPVPEPVAEPIAEPVEEPIAESVEEPIAEPVEEPIAEPVEEPIAEPVAEPTTEPVAEPVAPTFEPNDDGESEKALSEDEEKHSAVHSKHPSPEPEPEPEAAPALIQTSIEAQEEPAPPEEDAGIHAPEDDVQSEHRETVESSQLTAAPESEAPQAPLQDREYAEPTVSETAVEEAAEAPTIEEDSISVRPAKRQRKTEGQQIEVKRKGRMGRPPRRAVSATTASEDLAVSSVEPSANVSTATGHRRPYPKRGAVFYRTESGADEMTFSLLIMAAVKRESTKRGGDKRHNTAFGIPTPLFKEYDFELPESFFYPEGDVSRLPKAADDPVPQQGAETSGAQAEDGTEANAAEDDDERAEGSEDLEETKEADEREGSEAADSEMTEPMDIDQPDPVKDVPTTRASTTDEDEPEEDELTDEIDIMPEPDNEPGVTPRELSFPLRDDQDEELEW
ncbi:hypothetical protein D9619_002609 [Psilocybe cf. subviscida]|uniref:PEHE domain-containing protein n=1 Tax=Psilocybe cf. subviscida TaxID=2480587 RepID=A0A8H5AYH7_9AGAR|nr:hypothetical protein D9619_002609 [Psilocybe cf. subviscida]